MQRIVSATKIVATDAGVMAMVESRMTPAFDELLDLDGSNVCSLRWAPANFSGPASIDIRPCGESTWETHEVEDVDLAMGRSETTWTELHRSLDHLTTLAIGDDEVVIAHHSANGPTSIRLPIKPAEAE